MGLGKLFFWIMVFKVVTCFFSCFLGYIGSVLIDFLCDLDCFYRVSIFFGEREVEVDGRGGKDDGGTCFS